MLPEPLQQAIDKLPEESRVVVQALVLYYELEHEQLKARIKELEDQISKNSRNSSKPPSSDAFAKRAPKSRRVKSGRKAGGQGGHKGTNLKLVDSPDKIRVHRVKRCSCCGVYLGSQQADGIQRRQVYDHPPLELIITEHRGEVKRCSCGHLNYAEFPKGVDHYVQYGPNIKGLLVYMQDYQLLPYERTREFVQDLFGHCLSTGTLYNIRNTAFDQLADFEDRLKVVLTAAVVAGFDETGIRIMAQRLWLHSCSTNRHAYYEAHAKRGQIAMDHIGILPNFKGIAVHDFWKSYYRYGCKHSLCNAHLLRDLSFIKERFEQIWPDKLMDLLLKMKAAKEKAMAQGKSGLSSATLGKYRLAYGQIVDEGLAANPFEMPDTKKRGRPKKTPPRNLLERLRDYAQDILRFFYDFSVPFDNNFSERDLRMMKVKQKISGCFRSFEGAKCFARIRSFIITARKQNVNVFKALSNLFTGNDISLQLVIIRGAE